MSILPKDLEEMLSNKEKFESTRKSPSEIYNTLTPGLKEWRKENGLDEYIEIYCLKDNEGILRPQAFLCYPDILQYADKAIKRLTKDGSTIVLVKISEK